MKKDELKDTYGSVAKEKAARKSLQKSLKEISDYKYALDESSIVAITDQKGIIQYANDNFCKISKYNREELIGQDHRIVNSGYHSKEFIRNLWVTIANGKIWKGELENKAKDGTIYWVDTTIVPFLNALGKPYQYVAIRSDITERKRLEEQQSLLASIVNFSDDAILSRSLGGIVTTWNRGAEKIFGYTSDEIIGSTITILIPPHLLHEEGEIMNKISRGEVLDHYETLRVRKDGKIINVSLTISPLKDSRGTVVGASKISRDITQQKTAEENLKRSLKETSDYKYALEESSIVAITDQKGIIKYANDNFCNISKYKREELIGQDHRIISSGYHAKEFIRNLWVTIANGKIWKGELKNKAKDGTIYWVDTTIVPFLNEQGKPYQYVAIRADITERKNIEENLQKSLKETSDYKYALEESSIVAITDQKGIIRYANDNFCKISKYSHEELIGRDHRIINSGYHEKEFIRNLWATIANGKIWKGELKNKAKDGTIYWVDTTIVPFLNADDKPYQYVAIRADITERKNIEENLQKSLKETSDYKYALEESSIVAITDQKGIIKYANDNFCNISKYKREELIGQDHRIINSGYHSAEFIRNLWVTIANGKIWRGELKNKARDGTIYWVDTTIVPFLNEQGKPYQYVAIRSDITERKTIEEKIYRLNTELDRKASDHPDDSLQSKNLLSQTLHRVSFLASIADNIQDPVITSDSNSVITRWNSPAEKLLEWKSEEVVGRNVTEVLNVIYLNQAREQILVSFNEKGFWQGELVYHTKSGRLVNVMVTTSKLKNADRNETGTLLLIKDITERIQAEKQLKEFEHFFNNNNDLCGIANTVGYFETINTNFCKVLGYTEREFCETPFIERIHPDDVALTLREYEKLKSGERTINFINRYRKKDDTYLYLDWNATPNSLTGKLYCVARDITERKLVDEKIHFLATITGHIEDIIIASDNNFKITYWNDAAEKLLGWKREEVIGKTTFETFTIEYPDVTREQVIESFYQKGYWQGEAIYYTKSGTKLPVLGTASSLKDASGIAIGHLVLVRDITNRKKAEEALNKLNSELEAFSYSVSHDLRAPLRAVNGYARMLKEDYGTQLDSEANRILSNIVNNSIKMSQLIDGLLSFSRLGRKEIQKAKVLMSNVVDEVCRELKDMDSLRIVTYEMGELLPAWADSMLIKQVWTNLISNALKYSKQKQQTVIEIGSVLKGAEIVYHVKDNGAGFDMRFADKLFGVFRRLHSDQEFEGTGVGLAIVQRIVSKHGGKVWAEGKLNEGATFYFSLPETK